MPRPMSEDEKETDPRGRGWPAAEFIFTGDCIDMMNSLPANSIDLIFMIPL